MKDLLGKKIEYNLNGDLVSAARRVGDVTAYNEEGTMMTIAGVERRCIDVSVWEVKGVADPPKEPSPLTPLPEGEGKPE